MLNLELPRRLAGSAPTVESEAWRVLGLSRAGLGRFLSKAQAAVGLRGEVDVLLTSDRSLRRLNREFRGYDKATDVLSFPSAGFESTAGITLSGAAEQSPAAEGSAHGTHHAGDLAISLETAQAQAAEHGHSLRDELRVLLLHGLLHLAGMDHESDHGEMAAREAALRQMLRLPRNLIARVTDAPLAGQPEQAIRSLSRRSAPTGRASGVTRPAGSEAKLERQRARKQGKRSARSAAPPRSRGDA